MKREEILDNAKKCVTGHRSTDYGTPENNFGIIASLWNTYLAAAHKELHGVKSIITGKDVAMMMSLLKVARIASSNSADSYIDLAGYAACAGEIATMNDENKSKPIPPQIRHCPVCNTVLYNSDITCPNCGKETGDPF